MEVLRETTNWEYANHSYVVHNNRVLAYQRAGEEGWTVFSKPLSFSKRGRSFSKIKGEVEKAMLKHFGVEE